MVKLQEERTVNVTDASSNSAVATFTVTPSISISPTIGNAGSTVTVSGSGFASNKQITATYAGSPLHLAALQVRMLLDHSSGATFSSNLNNRRSSNYRYQRRQLQLRKHCLHSKHVIPKNHRCNGQFRAHATVTVNGGSPSPNSFAADGTPYNILMVAGDTFNLSFSNNGNTRDGFTRVKRFLCILIFLHGFN